MYKYISENELNTFRFHDCYIKDIIVERDCVKWILGYISVKENNHCNPYNLVMDTDEAVITFYNCKYKKGIKQFPEQEIYIQDNSIEFINQIINECDMLYGEQTEEGKGYFEIDQNDYLFFFCVEFSRVTVEWNGFNGESWSSKRS